MTQQRDHRAEATAVRARLERALDDAIVAVHQAAERLTHARGALDGHDRQVAALLGDLDAD